MSGARGLRRHQPGSVLGGAAALLAAATAGLVGPLSLLSLGATAVGVLGVTAGLVREDRRFAGLGAVALLAGVLAAGAAGAPTERLLPAIATGLLSWEFGSSSFERRADLRGGTVERSELLHVATATGVAALSAGVAYAVFRSADLGVSVLGAALLFLAAVALGLSLRE